LDLEPRPTSNLAAEPSVSLPFGVTSDLVKRVWKHKNHTANGFTKKYNVNKLVYYEIHQESLQAIAREKKLKYWRRAWKIALIEKQNPEWNDLYENL
jgi:putative endonuclease